MRMLTLGAAALIAASTIHPVAASAAEATNTRVQYATFSGFLREVDAEGYWHATNCTEIVNNAPVGPFSCTFKFRLQKDRKGFLDCAKKTSDIDVFGDAWYRSNTAGVAFNPQISGTLMAGESGHLRGTILDLDDPLTFFDVDIDVSSVCLDQQSPGSKTFTGVVTYN